MNHHRRYQPALFQRRGDDPLTALGLAFESPILRQVIVNRYVGEDFDAPPIGTVAGEVNVRPAIFDLPGGIVLVGFPERLERRDAVIVVVKEEVGSFGD